MIISFCRIKVKMLIVIQHILGLLFTARTGAYSRFLYMINCPSRGGGYVYLSFSRCAGALGNTVPHLLFIVYS